MFNSYVYEWTFSVSVDSITDGDRRALGVELPVSSTYSGAFYNQNQSQSVRRSLPNMMAHSMLIHEPAKIYPYHLLLITNYRLPADVDRCNLERHLSDSEFDALFGVTIHFLIKWNINLYKTFDPLIQCNRSEFYRLPQWRRSELKRRAKLF